MTQAKWGRFTARGGHQVEGTVASVVEEVGSLVDAAVPPGQLAALVLLGGYGRGEGGVELREGREQPHNNLDFLLLTRDLDEGARGRLQQELDGRLAPVVKRRGVGLDVSLLPARKLAGSSCQVMWYDMRFGHKTVRGDASLVPGLAQFTQAKLPAFDVLNLLVNRSTLLVINQFLEDRGVAGESARRTEIKHAIKAVLGIGDAFLFTRGQYHWSYCEKQTRMQRLTEAPERLRSLYHRAMEFRFQPDYSAPEVQDSVEWTRDLLTVAETVHRGFEGFRLGARELAWEGYLERAFASLLGEILVSPRRLARGLLRWNQGPGLRSGLGAQASAGLALASARERLSLLFPLVAYGVGSEAERSLCAELLGAPDSQPASLRWGYLRSWADAGDHNFELVLKRLGVDLREEGR